jgi:predicted ATPase/class 3 adenylate cyclase
MIVTEQSNLPSGTVTFLQTDIENSSGWWESAPAEMRVALAGHDALVADVVHHHGGHVVKHLGDGCWAAFESAPKAVAAAIDFQHRHQQADDGTGLHLVMRLGLHTGEIEPTGRDYFGPVVNRMARIVDLANGNQIVCSASTAGLVTDVDLRSEGVHELRGIGSEEVFLVFDPAIETSPQPLRRPIAPSNLPRPKTSFVGRDDQLATAVEFISGKDGLVTMIGPGGVGKTRLAIEVASRVAAEFRQHVYFCDLVPIANDDADAVYETVAEIVGARRQPGMDLIDSVVDYLAGRRALILLDNCEHVIDTVRILARRLLESVGVQILATSREALAMHGEQQVIVSPLATGTAGVELFVDRARNRDAHFELTSDNRAAVLDVVERLDGIPLAVELAAARIRLLSPVELAERLRDGFKVLEGAGESQRHGTLRNTVRWSYELLSPPEAALFAQLSVFAGGFSLGAAEAICADDSLVDADAVPDLMLALVDKSMIESHEHAGHRRFRMLETLRSFAVEKLADAGSVDVVRARHADYFRGLAARQRERLWGPAEPDAWRVLDDEWSNLRSALDTYEAAGNLDSGAELVVSLAGYAAMSMRFELFSWAKELLALPGVEDHPQYTDLCGAAALGSYFTLDDRVTEWAETGLAANPSDPEGLCRCALAAVFLNNVHAPEASDALTSTWLASDPQSTFGRVWAHGFRTFHLALLGEAAEAAKQAAAVSQIADESGSLTANALAAWANGQAQSFVDLDLGMETWRQGIEFCRSLPRDHLIDQMLVGAMLHLTARRGELSTTLVECRDALQSALAQHYYTGTSHLFGVTAIALTRAGDAPTGARLIGSMIKHGHLPRRNARRELESALGDDLDDLLVIGSSLSITQAGRVAIEARERVEEDW